MVAAHPKQQLLQQHEKQELTLSVLPPFRLQHGGREEPGPAQAAQEALQGGLLSRAGLRAGAPLQPPAVPVRSGARRPGGLPQAHRDSSQDLVPEPPLQDEAPPDGRRSDGVHPGGQEGGGEGAGAGRPETVQPRGDRAAAAALLAAVLLLPVRLLPPRMDTVCVCGEPVTVFIPFLLSYFLFCSQEVELCFVSDNRGNIWSLIRRYQTSSTSPPKRLELPRQGPAPRPKHL